jgi:dCTP deaminase
MILPGQLIREMRIFDPFEERSIQSGLSYGLSSAGYDVRLRDDVTVVQGYTTVAVTLEHIAIPPDLLGLVKDKSTWVRKGIQVQNTVIEPGWHGYLAVELTYQPILTPQELEALTNLAQLSGIALSPRIWIIRAGTPIAQILLHELREPAERPYGEGKYQGQRPDDVHAKLEGQAGGEARSGEVSGRG